MADNNESEGQGHEVDDSERRARLTGRYKGEDSERGALLRVGWITRKGC